MVHDLYNKIANMHREEFNKILHDDEKSLKDIQTSFSYTIPSLNEDQIYFDKIEKTIFKYFKCINGFIGRDFLQLQHSLFDLLVYKKIIETEDNNNNLNAELELQTRFYFVLNCIYNIREKFLSFVGANYNNGKAEFKSNKGKLNTSLSTKGIKEFSSVFEKVNNTIGEYTRARNIIEHSSYDLSYNSSKQLIEIQVFTFNLTRSKDNNKGLYLSFAISDDKLKKLINALYTLRDDFYMLVMDRSNIDKKVYLNKFIYNENGRIVRRITS